MKNSNKVNSQDMPVADEKVPEITKSKVRNINKRFEDLIMEELARRGADLIIDASSIIDEIGGCSGGCKGSCQGSCWGNCDTTCATTCGGSCDSSCEGDCAGTCEGQSIHTVEANVDEAFNEFLTEDLRKIIVPNIIRMNKMFNTYKYPR